MPKFLLKANFQQLFCLKKDTWECKAHFFGENFFHNLFSKPMIPLNRDA